MIIVIFSTSFDIPIYMVHFHDQTHFLPMFYLLRHCCQYGHAVCIKEVPCSFYKRYFGKWVLGGVKLKDFTYFRMDLNPPKHPQQDSLAAS